MARVIIPREVPVACGGGRTLGLAAPAPAVAGALDRYAPVFVHASAEPDTLTDVRAFAGRVPVVEPGPGRARPWLQYRMRFAYNAEDRGLLRTGRHEGDWEMPRCANGGH